MAEGELPTPPLAPPPDCPALAPHHSRQATPPPKPKQKPNPNPNPSPNPNPNPNQVLPSSETVQVLILAIFAQLVCSNIFHKYLDTSTVFDIAAVALMVGAVGSVFV